VDNISTQNCLQHQQCNKLDQYLKNSTKIFTSNVKVYFNAGTHYLDKMLIINNAHNLSLLGVTSNGSARVVCTNQLKAAGIILVNTSNIAIHNLAFINCKANGESLFYIPPRRANVFDIFDSNLPPLPVTKASLIIVNSTDLQLQNIAINNRHAVAGLLCVNIWGTSCLESVYSTGLEVYYTRMFASNKTIVLIVNQYQPLDFQNESYKQWVHILAHKCASRLQIILSNIMFSKLHSISIGLKRATRITFIVDHCLLRV